MQISTNLLALLLALAIVISMCASGVEARPKRHHKRGLTSEYDYRDNQDYTDNAGIFVDAVPITTNDPTNSRPHQHTNRFPKLRKFFAESERYFH